MTEAEMAGSAASPPGTIKSRLNTARRNLSKLLRPQLRAERTASLAVPLDRRGGGEDHD
jgi:DNA-directed RNA polymerase specialized sigma24 family protein